MEMVALQPVPPAPVAVSLPPIVIPAHGMGGNLDEHRQLFATYRAYGLSVELRGPCYSACTILTSYVGKDTCASQERNARYTLSSAIAAAVSAFAAAVAVGIAVYTFLNAIVVE